MGGVGCCGRVEVEVEVVRFGGGRLWIRKGKDGEVVVVKVLKVILTVAR